MNVIGRGEEKGGNGGDLAGVGNVPNRVIMQQRKDFLWQASVLLGEFGGNSGGLRGGVVGRYRYRYYICWWRWRWAG